MRCFAHHETDAVAICKYCAKALCPACAVAKPIGVSCAGPCEERVATLDTILQRSKTSFRTLGTFLWAASGAFGILGLVAAWLVASEVRRSGFQPRDAEAAVLAAILLGAAVGLSFLALSYSRRKR